MRYRLLLPIAVLACLSSAIAAPQTASGEAKNHLNQGIEALKQYRYESAVEHFRQARKLDPQSRTAAMYLATALGGWGYVPGVDTPDNLQVASEAIDIFKQVLALDPQSVTAFKWLGFLEMGTRNYEEAKSYYHQASQAAATDPEAFYSVGVVDWVQAYRQRAEERSKRGLSINGPSSIMQPFCAKLRANNLPLVDDGIQVMNRSLELRPDYDDAMAYLNLLYRERAEIQCHDRAARSSDQRQADEWTGKAMEARKRNLEKYKDSEPSAPSPEPLLSQPPPPPPLAPPPPPPPQRHPPKVVTTPSAQNH